MRFNLTNPCKTVYEIFVWLASRLDLYNTRASRYVKLFEHKISKTEVVLDLGCGNGGFSERLVSHSGYIVALDVDRTVLRAKRSDKAVHKICADAEHIPIRQDSINVVIAISSLEHIPNVNVAISEVHRILKTSGLFIIQLPNPQWYIEPHTKFPLLFVLNDDLKRKIANQFGYDFINFRLTLKNLQKITKTYFLTYDWINLSHGIKLPFWPPAWLIVLKKFRVHE